MAVYNLRGFEAGKMKLADGGLNTALNDPCGNGVAGKTGRVMDVKLFHKMLAVFFNRFDADLKF